MYSINVQCFGCPKKPWDYIRETYRIGKSLDQNEHKDPENDFHINEGPTWFTPTATEIKYGADKIESEITLENWTFEDLLNESATAKPKYIIHKEALGLLSAMLKASDAKLDNQRLVCLDGDSAKNKTTCKNPFAFVHDLGTTFIGNWVIELPLPNMKLSDWEKAGVWKGRGDTDIGGGEDCIYKVRGYPTSKLKDRQIRVESRDFLVNLFKRVTEKQKLDVFRASRVHMIEKDITTKEKAEEYYQKWVTELNEKIASLSAPGVCAKGLKATAAEKAEVANFADFR